MNSRNKGVITVEAALILPMIIVLCFSLLLFFQILTVQVRMQAALEEATKQLAVAEYFGNMFEEVEGQLAGGLAGYVEKYVVSELNEELVGTILVGELGKNWLDKTMIRGGSKGLKVTQSLLARENSLIDVRVDYSYVLPLIPGNIISLDFSQRSVRRMWTGKQVLGSNGKNEGTDDEPANEESYENVYITKTGKVYHIYRDCSTLKRTVKSCSFSDITDKRNDSGGKFYPCEYCKRGDSNVVVYYTVDGNRYHNSRTCGSLMRYISEISMKDIGVRPLCKVCQKRKTAIESELNGVA